MSPRSGRRSKNLTSLVGRNILFVGVSKWYGILETKPQNKTRRKLWWYVLPGALVLALAGLVLAFTSPAGSELELEAIRQSGLPISPEDLNRWYPQVEDAKNAALLVLKAAEKQVSPSRELTDLRMPGAGEPLSPEARQLIRVHLENNAPALQQLSAASELRESRYPINLALPRQFPNHLTQAKSLAQLLRYAAVYESSEGNAESAFRSMRSGLALARTLREEPVLISELVRIACVAIALNSLEHLLSKHSLEEKHLIELMHMLAEAEDDSNRSGFRALVGGRALDIPQLTNQGPPTAQGWEPRMYEMFGLAGRDRRIYLQVMEQLTAAMSNPFPKAFEMTLEAEDDMDRRLSSGFGRLAMYSRMSLPALPKAIQKEAAITTHLRCARASLGVELYRNQHGGELPENLGEIVPEYLPEELRDPVEGKPLELRKRSMGPGYQITSPGAAVILQNKQNTSFVVYR